MKSDNKKKKKQHNNSDKNKDFIDGGIDFIDSGIKTIKKEISLFYRINIIFFIPIFLILCYYLILVQIKPFSIPILSNKIDNILKEKIDESVEIKEVKFSFTSYGTIKIEVTDFKSQEINKKNENIDIEVPSIGAEFSIFKLFLAKYQPEKITVSDPKVRILNLEKNNNKTNILPQDYHLYLKKFSEIISNLQKKQNYDKNIEIQNLSIFTESDERYYNLKIKNISLKIVSDNETNRHNLYLTSNFYLFNDKEEIIFNNLCLIENNNDIGCKISINNLNLKEINDLLQNQENQLDIASKINFIANFKVKDKFEYFNFKADSKYGHFFLDKFFNNKINYRNFVLNGNFDFNQDLLNIDSINFDLKPIYEKNNENINYSNIDIKYLVTGFFNDNHKNSLIDISLKNVDIKNLNEFWPNNLEKADKTRKWLVEHFKDGEIKNATLKIETIKKGFNNYLESLVSELYFDNLDINYSENFPEVNNLSGIAKFDKKSMNINVESGEVLESKVKNSKVIISDFKNPTLELKLNISGNGSDELKHISFSSKNFVNEIKKYLHGETETFADIKIPLNKKVNLTNVFINVKMKAKNILGKYFDGDIKISSKKNVNSRNFITNFDFTKSNFYFLPLSLNKKKNEISSLKIDFDISNYNYLLMKNIKLIKKSQKKNELVYGKIRYNFKSKFFDQISLNNNFGKNSYKLFFNKSNNNNIKASIKGWSLDLSGFIADRKNHKNLDEKIFYFNELNLFSSLKRIYLSNKKMLRNLTANFNCKNQICYNGSIKSKYSIKNLDFINFSVLKDKKSKKYNIIGNISDVGYLSEALDISDKILGGNAKLQITQDRIDKDIIYKGEAEIKKEITFYENNRLKKLSKNDLYSKIKDKIFSNDKTIFNYLKTNFELKNYKYLTVKSFIANNYKIGVTAKGNINLFNKNFDFKGMIIPGFIVNNLFGIGNIPVLGGVISNLLTGGEGGGVFGLKYRYYKDEKNIEPNFETYPVSSFVPSTVRNLFDDL